jgi:hypothetical protein
MTIGNSIQRIGHIRAFAALAGLVAASIFLKPVLVSAPFWIAARALTGFGCAGLFIATESWLNAKATRTRAARSSRSTWSRPTRPMAAASSCLHLKARLILEGKAAIVPRPEPPWLAEPKELAVMMVLVAEVTLLEMRRMAEFEHEIPIPEVEHETAPAEMPGVPQLEVWSLPELESKTTVVEVPEVP